jgi:RNA polymerase sigma factor (sigma-70 family)
VEVSALKPSAIPALRGPSPLLRLQSDERLIALVRRGQHHAFEVLVARYQTRLLAFCRHMLGSREDAEDVLQEVFAAAFNAILADERAINVRPWLYRIARNRSLNHLRRASAIGVDSMDVHYADHGLSTAERVLRRESFRQLIGDVHRLPETQRTALLLREIDALSYEQIAHAMETTVPAVKSLLVRARISLAEAAEARKLSCDEARVELGEAAEGLVKISPSVRRHVRDCERCRAFRKHLKDNNVALAAMLPVGPLLLLKKLALTKLGSTAGASGAHVAGGAGAAAGAGMAGATGGIGATGGLVTAGASALATKAVAGLAVAALVTAGTVEAERAASRSHSHHRTVAAVAQPGGEDAGEPVITRSISQPVTLAPHRQPPAPAPSTKAAKTKPAGPRHTGADLAASSQAAGQTPAQALSKTTPAPAKPTATRPGEPPVEQVTTETTQLPASASSSPTPPSPAGAGAASSPATTGGSPAPAGDASPEGTPTTAAPETAPPPPPAVTTAETPPAPGGEAPDEPPAGTSPAASSATTGES